MPLTLFKTNWIAYIEIINIIRLFISISLELVLKTFSKPNKKLIIIVIIKKVNDIKNVIWYVKFILLFASLKFFVEKYSVNLFLKPWDNPKSK